MPTIKIPGYNSVTIPDRPVYLLTKPRSIDFSIINDVHCNYDRWLSRKIFSVNPDVTYEKATELLEANKISLLHFYCGISLRCYIALQQNLPMPLDAESILVRIGWGKDLRDYYSRFYRGQRWQEFDEVYSYYFSLPYEILVAQFGKREKTGSFGNFMLQYVKTWFNPNLEEPERRIEL